MQSSSPNSERSGTQPAGERSVRPWLRNSLIAAGLVCIAAVVLVSRKGSSRNDSVTNQASAPDVVAPKPSGQVQGGLAGSSKAADGTAGTGAAQPVAGEAGSPAPAPKPEPSAYTRQLVSSLFQLQTAPGAMTA